MARGGHFRAHERRVVSIGAYLRHERTGWVREAQVLDLSLAGAGLAIAEPVEVGTPVVLELAAPTLWDPLSLRGSVVWCQRRGGADAPARAGVAFEHDASESLVALVDVLTTTLYELTHRRGRCGAPGGGRSGRRPCGGVCDTPRRRMSAPLSVAYFGLPLGALLLAADGHRLALVASCRRRAPGVRRAARLFGERFLVRPDASDLALARRVRESGAQLLVSWFWTKRLPPSLLTACPLGTVGVHPSLLPRHRGPDPYYWTIRCGDEVAGVSAHRLAEAYDTGAVLGRRAIAVDPSWNAWQLARALDRPSLALLRDVVGRFAAGDAPPEEPQDEALATQAPEPDDDETALRFARPTDEVLRQVRALAPSPGAIVEIAGESVAITRAEPAAEFPAALAPCEAALVGGRAVVRTADGAVALLEGEVDGQALGPEALAELVARAG